MKVGIRRVPRTIVRKTYRLIRRRAGMRQLAAGGRHGVIVRDAVAAALAEDLTAEERAVVARIENRRTALLASTEMISKEDFGAGSKSERAGGKRGEHGPQRSGFEVRDVAKATSKGRTLCLLLFGLVRRGQCASLLELGTSVGISGAYQAGALSINGGGNLVTLEGAGEVAQIACRTFEALELDNARVVVGRFDETLDDVLAQSPTIDYAFIDGHHDGPATLAYYEKIKANAAPGAMFMFDDIRWSDAMLAAWNRITRDPHVELAVDFGSMGLCIFGRAPAGRYSQVVYVPIAL